MSYTDKELKEATQIAYLNCIEKNIKNLIADGETGPFTLKELISQNIDLDLAKKNLALEGKSIEKMKLQELAQYSDMSDLDKEIIGKLSDEMLEWKIADIHDMTSENGFYSCVIETSPKDAIVAFRGSEGTKTYSGLVYDWIDADFGLLNSKRNSPTN